MNEKINTKIEYSFWRTFSFFFNSLGRYRLGFCLTLVGFGICSLLFFIANYLFSKVIDALVIYKSASLDSVYLLIFGVLGAYGLDKIIRSISGYFLNNIKIKTQIELRKNIFDKLAKFDLKWHQDKNSGAKVEKINSGLKGYTNLFELFEWSIMWNLVNFIIPLIFFASLGWKYILVFGIFGVYVTLIKIKLQKIINENNKKLESIQEVSTNKFFEFSNNILTIKALNAIEVFKKSIFNSDDERKQIQLRNNKLETSEDFSRSLGETIIIDLALIFLLLNDFASSNITLGVFQLAFTNSWSITWAIINFSRVLHQINEAKIKISRLIPIFEEVPNEFFGIQKFLTNWKELEFSNLDFNYKDSKKNALKNINLTLEKGKKYGFVGHSGSGKSTLTKLIVGLFKLDSGTITFVNGPKKQDFYSINAIDIHNKITIVLQETELFDLTLRENITMLKTIDEAYITKACSVAQLDSVINKLPNGLDTKLGEKGYKLSGGEKQRLGIARALLSEADIIIFDESTSALDTETERKIQEGIEVFLKDKTMIMVAHRLSTLKNVDKLFVFSNGKLIEEGSFEKLLSKADSKFYQLWHNQNFKP
ncbi:MAG: ABC transporter ATP-binding protein [Patescibacteria group bacterium]